MADKLVTIFAGKLGIYSPKVISKASELNRLLEVKASSQAFRFLNVTAAAQVVICLEFAAQISNIPIDKNEAIKLSGLKKRIYQNCHHALGNILDVRSAANIPDLGIQFGCLQAVQLAESILQRYRDSLQAKYAFSQIDISKPVYTVVAFYTACRILKVKVDKQKLMELSREQKMTILPLMEEMNKIASEIPVSAPKKCKRKADSIETGTGDFPARKQKVKIEDEDYNEWKERMLQSDFKEK